MQFYIVDAFTDALFGGNPAGVVLLGEGQNFPAEAVMLKTAAELRYSETAFVKRLGPGAFHTRYFTPAAEVDLCGHATVAAFHVLAVRGEAGASCTNQTLAGQLDIQVSNDTIFMEMGKPQLIGSIDAAEDLDALYRVMGLRGADAPDLPVELISTGLPDIMLPVVGEEQLAAIAPDFPALAALSKRYAVTGVHAFTLAAADGSVHCRNFAPLYDIDEEAATGTSNGALTWYLHRRGLVEDGGETLFIQGEAMGRPSKIRSRLAGGPGGATIWVGGTAVVLAQGEIHIA